MQLLKITFLTISLLAIVLSFTSCKKYSEKKKENLYLKTGIVLSGAQETPATPSTATGSLDVTYDKTSRTLTYKFTWSGLTDTITGIHIHGLAPTGYAAAIVQNILTIKNEAAFPFRGGSYSGFLFADGVKVKEEDILNHLYYLNIHTKGINPNGGNYLGGEIRGQIRFQ